MSDHVHTPVKGVYLLHFSDKVGGRALHYVGYSDDVERRISEHRGGYGARLMAVVKDNGMTFEVARVWEGADRKFERHIKKMKNHSKYCPICRKGGK